MTRFVARCAEGPLRDRDFRLLSLGQLTSTVGDFCYAVALPWFVLSAHAGTMLLGAVLACYGVPRAALIPLGGILADKIGARRVMLGADVIRCLMVAALSLLAARHAASLGLIAPVAALLGAGEGVFIPASYSIMPTILQPQQLAAGNALSTAMVQAGALIGPLLGGVLVATAGSAPAFAVDAASFAVSAVALGMLGTRRPAGGQAIRRQASPPPSGVTLWTLLRESRLLQIILGICVAANLTAGGAFGVALPVLAHTRYGASGYGALITCLGGGSVIGTLAAGRAGGLRRPAVFAFCVFLVSAIATCLMPFSGGLTGTAITMAIFGMCNGFSNIICFTLIQRWAPSGLLGRVMSLVMLAGIGSYPASVAATGFLVRHLGPVPFFPVAGIVLAVALLAGLTRLEIRDFGVAKPETKPAVATR